MVHGWCPAERICTTPDCVGVCECWRLTWVLLMLVMAIIMVCHICEELARYGE